MSVFGTQNRTPAPKPRLPRVQELVNTFEFEDVARLVLDAATVSSIAAIDRAVTAGCKVVCLTAAAKAAMPWKTMAAIGKGLDTPIVIKGVMTPDEARTAIDNGAKGIVVSDHGAIASKASTIDALVSIV